MDSLKAPPQAESRLHFLDYWRIIRIRKTIIFAVFLLVAVTATIVTFILPSYYASTAQIRVTRDAPDIESMTGREQTFLYDPYYMETEFKVMESKEVLARVVSALDLNHKWGKKLGGGDQALKTDDTINFLRQTLDLRPVRNTTLIDITAKSDKPEEAADIAQAVAEAYRDYRDEDRQRRMLGGLDALRADLANQEKKIADASAEVERLRKKYNVADTLSTSTAIAPSMDSETIVKIQDQLTDYQVKYDQLATNLALLHDLSRDKLRAVLPRAMDSPDSQLMSLLDQLNNAQIHLRVVAKDNTPEHPDYINAAQIVDDLDKKVDECVDGIMRGLEQKAAGLRASVDLLQSKLDEAKHSDIARTTEQRPYYQAKEQLQRLEDFRKVLEFKIQQTVVDAKIPTTAAVTIIEPAKVEPDPVWPNKKLNIILGIVVGLVVGVALAFFIEYLDTSVKTIDDVERALQAPVLGVIPQNVGVLLEEGAESPHAEAYRVLRTNLLFSRKDDKLNTVCVVSAGAGEGKSTTILNLATVFAQSGHRVLLVDSDLRRPTLHKYLKLSNNLGLTNALLKQNSLEEVIQRTGLPTLDLLPSGKLPSSSLSILSSAQMRDLITELKRRYDFVFFDSPPIMGVSDASVLASEMDMTVQVIQYRRYPQPMNIRAKQMVEKVGGNLIGIVLNNINMSQDESYYYYSGYYHGYYYSRDEDQVPVASGELAANATDKPAEIKQKY